MTFLESATLCTVVVLGIRVHSCAGTSRGDEEKDVMDNPIIGGAGVFSMVKCRTCGTKHGVWSRGGGSCPECKFGRRIEDEYGSGEDAERLIFMLEGPLKYKRFLAYREQVAQYEADEREVWDEWQHT